MTALTTEHVRSIFMNLQAGNPSAFFDHVSEHVDWLVTGESHQLARRWTSKSTFFNESFMRIGRVLTKPMKLEILNIMVAFDNKEGKPNAGLEGTAIVEMKGFDGTLLNGKDYSNEYCWIVKFDAEGKIIGVKAYLDTAKLRDALDENPDLSLNSMPE